MANSPLIDGQCGVRIYFAGQIGNQLFHYCLGRIIATKYGHAFDPPPEFVDWQGKPVAWSGEPLFTMQPIAGRRYPEEQSFQFGATHWYDLDTLPADKPVHACYGHWCNYSLYANYRWQIRNKWLKLPEHSFVETDPEAVYVHARLRDFVQGYEGRMFNPAAQGISTSVEDFARGLREFPEAKRLVIVTDDCLDISLDGFDALGLPFTIRSGKWDEDFMLLASCQNLLMSMSTFSWWAGWLGRAKKIVCPLVEGSAWAHGQVPGADKDKYPNLYVTDEADRWRFV